MNEQNDIVHYEKLSALSDDELLLQLGTAIRPSDLGAGPASRGDLIKRARQWMQEERSSLAQLICADPRISAFRAGKNSDHFGLFLVVCDCVSSAHGGLPVATIATLLVRLGLDTLCGKVPQK